MVATEAIAKLRSALPTGQTLPKEAWERRHRWMLASLWLQMAGIAAYSLLRGYGLGHTVTHLLPMLATTLLAASGRLTRRLRSVAAAFAMLTGAAIAVHISGGLIEAHFYFFVVIVVLSLYEDWLPFLLAIGYVVIHHGLIGTIDPSGVYAAGSPGVTNPWQTAGVHGAFIAAAGAAAVIGWRLNEDVREAARRSQEQFRRSFEEAPIGMALCDASGVTIAANQSLCATLGYSRDELLGSHFTALAHPDDVERSRAALRALDNGRQEVSLEQRYLNSDGETVWASVHVSKLVEPGGEDRFIVQAQDVTARKRADEEAAIRSSQQQGLLALGRVALSSEKLDNLFRKAIELVAENLEAEQVRVIEYIESDSGPQPHLAADLAGAPRSKGLTLTAAERAAASAGQVVALDREAATTIRDQGGRTFGVLSARGAGEAFSGQDLGFVEAVAHVLSGAVQRHRSEEELRYQSLHDPLVGLPNRVLLLDRVERALQRLGRHEGSIAVIFLDLDRFKLINDSLGHEAGDQLLQAVVPRLRGVLRENDTLARFGGDEFVVLCEELDDSTEAMVLAGRLHQAFKEPFAIGDQVHSVNASLGVAVGCAEHRGCAEELIRDADAAMYRAKAAGGGRIELFDEVLRARILQRLEIEGGLRKAIAEQRLELHYQPIVDLAGGEIARSEALVRWRHPERGPIPPDEFIPVAEDSGLILPLGAWVMEEACRQMEEWSRTGPPELAAMSVAINLSALQVAQDGIVEMIGDALDRHGIEPGRLICEITESALITNPESAAQTLLELDALGVSVALDDFGTGYSSLASLKRFRLAAIKLDRSFIKDLTPSSRDAKILGSLVSMAESLGLGVVAEGVETAAQRRQLEEMGCQVAQGFLFGHPVAPDVFRSYFAGAAKVS